MNQRIVYAIANQVAVDLLGHREMHAYRVSLPVVAPFLLLFPLFVRMRFPRAVFGGADFCCCAFLMGGASGGKATR